MESDRPADDACLSRRCIWAIASVGLAFIIFIVAYLPGPSTRPALADSFIRDQWLHIEVRNWNRPLAAVFVVQGEPPADEHHGGLDTISGSLVQWEDAHYPILWEARNEGAFPDRPPAAEYPHRWAWQPFRVGPLDEELIDQLGNNEAFLVVAWQPLDYSARAVTVHEK